MQQEDTCHGGCHVCSLKSVHRCPFPWCNGGLMRAEERQETQPVSQVWQERGGWCQGARGRGQERGQSQA